MSSYEASLASIKGLWMTLLIALVSIQAGGLLVAVIRMCVGRRCDQKFDEVLVSKGMAVAVLILSICSLGVVLVSIPGMIAALSLLRSGGCFGWSSGTKTPFVITAIMALLHILGAIGGGIFLLLGMCDVIWSAQFDQRFILASSFLSAPDPGTVCPRFEKLTLNNPSDHVEFGCCLCVIGAASGLVSISWALLNALPLFVLCTIAARKKPKERVRHQIEPTFSNIAPPPTNAPPVDGRLYDDGSGIGIGGGGGGGIQMSRGDPGNPFMNMNAEPAPQQRPQDNPFMTMWK